MVVFMFGLEQKKQILSIGQAKGRYRVKGLYIKNALSSLYLILWKEYLLECVVNEFFIYIYLQR